MTIEGRINVDALFHDKEGTNSISVVSLRSSEDYTTGKVAIITGTAGSGQTTLIESSNDLPYLDASGSAVSIQNVSRVAFQWSGSQRRACDFAPFESSAYVTLASRNNSVSVSEMLGETAATQAFLKSGAGTGTYTILLYGT